MQSDMLPKPDRYELNDGDMEYLNSLNKKYENSAQRITKEMLEDIIITMELESGKE